MACYRGIWRLCYGWCLLCCILPTVEAATRVPVNMPSVQAQVEGAGAAAIESGALKVSSAPLGMGSAGFEYIEAATKNVPVRGILGGTTFGLNTIASGAKSLLKGGVQALLVGAALDQLLKGVDWVMTDGQLTKPSGTDTPVKTNAGQYQWTTHVDNVYASSPSEGCTIWGNTFHGGDTVQAVRQSDTVYECDAYHPPTEGYPGGYIEDYWSTGRLGSGCPDGSVLSSTTGACVSNTPLMVPVTDADMGAVDAYVNSQNADFVRNLLKDVCKNASGGSSPGSCYEAMKKQSVLLTGPSSVAGDSTTTSTAVANPDGTTSNVVTTNNTNYNLTYGPDYFDYTKSTASTTTTNGKTTSTTTTGETPADPNNPDPTKEQPSDPVASPCGTNCDGPAYQKLYEPTKDTKEQALDSYASRVADLPILKAATGFFNVSVGGGCPVWQVNTSLEVMSASMPINLIFDFHCQGWFTSVASYASAVMAIVCAFLAFRQAFLD